MKIGLVYFLVFMGLSYCCFAQVSVKDSAVNASLVPIGYSYNWPGGDMVKRFGDNSLVGGGYWFKSKKNWIIGFTGNYIFGGDVKENNVLELKFDKYGILADKKILNKDDMKKVKYSKNETTNEVAEKSFVNKFLSSIKQKMYGKKKF